jgi:hypothetical protein
MMETMDGKTGHDVPVASMRLLPHRALHSPRVEDIGVDIGHLNPPSMYALRVCVGLLQIEPPLQLLDEQGRIRE